MQITNTFYVMLHYLKHKINLNTTTTALGMLSKKGPLPNASSV